jgi:hypothetical protein
VSSPEHHLYSTLSITAVTFLALRVALVANAKQRVHVLHSRAAVLFIRYLIKRLSFHRPEFPSSQVLYHLRAIVGPQTRSISTAVWSGRLVLSCCSSVAMRRKVHCGSEGSTTVMRVGKLLRTFFDLVCTTIPTFRYSIGSGEQGIVRSRYLKVSDTE